MTLEDFNLILIGIDTLRHDHLSFSGYKRKTSPHIDALASESINFTNCFSQAPVTAPSFASIFTSRYPSYHGVTANIKRNVGWRLHPSVPTLAEILKKHGYRTAAFTEGGNLSRVVGLDRGFDVYETEPTDLLRAKRHPALQWLSRNKKERLFLFFHTFAVHAPYLPPRPFNTMYATGYKGVLPRSIEELRKQGGSFFGLMKTEKYKPEAIEHVKALYDGSINYMDQFIGSLLKTMRESGLDENTILVFTSDHGEEFMEHGDIYHRALYDELLHVPLLIRVPGAKQNGTRVEKIVKSIDIMPTVLELLSIREDGLVMQGESLFENFVSPALAEFLYHGFSIRTPQYKYIFDMRSKKSELYNITWDPEEKDDLNQLSEKLIEKLYAEFHVEKTKRGLVPAPQEMFIFKDRETVQTTKLNTRRSTISSFLNIWMN